MTQLIYNESVKIYRRLRTWIFVAIVLLALIAVCLVEHSSPSAQSGTQSGWDFTLTAANLLTLITIFVAVVAGDIVASEFSSGSIKLLLIRPVSRTKILWSKYLAVLLFALFFAVFLLVVAWLIGGFTFGFGGATDTYAYKNAAGHVMQIPMYAQTLRSYALNCIPLLMTVTVSFMISALLRSSALAIAISILLLFLGDTIVALLSRFAWDKYILFANENLMQYLEGHPSVKGMTLTFSIVALVVYFLIFHIVSWVAFTKRDVAA